MFGFNFSKSDSSSRSGLRGTPQFGQYAASYAGLGNTLANQAQGYANSDYGTFQGQSGAQLAGTDPNTGLPASMTNYLNTFANQKFSQTSAGGSLRGQVTPENTQGIVGSSLQNIGQFLTPYVVDWSKYQTGLPESIKQGRLGALSAPLQAMAPGIGAQQNSSAFGFGAQVGNTQNNSLWGS